MIEFAYTVLCHRAIQDHKTHNLSLIETFGRLTTFVHPSLVDETFGIEFKYVWASLWTNTGTEKRSAIIRASIQPPKGGEINIGEIPIDVAVGDTYKLRINLSGFELRGEGWYRFILRFKEEGTSRFKRAATLPLYVIYIESEDAPVIPLIPQNYSLKRDGE